MAEVGCLKVASTERAPHLSGVWSVALLAHSVLGRHAGQAGFPPCTVEQEAERVMVEHGLKLKVRT